MRWRWSLSHWLASAAAGLLSVSLLWALVGVNADPPRTTNTVSADGPEGITPLFAVTEPAANEPVLVLQADERGVHGWVAGKMAVADATVSLRAGARRHEVLVSADNTFEWKHAVNRNTPVTATLQLPDGKKLTARTTLLPAPPSRATQSSSSPTALPIAPATPSSSSPSSARCFPVASSSRSEIAT